MSYADPRPSDARLRAMAAQFARAFDEADGDDASREWFLDLKRSVERLGRADRRRLAWWTA